MIGSEWAVGPGARAETWAGGVSGSARNRLAEAAYIHHDPGMLSLPVHLLLTLYQPLRVSVYPLVLPWRCLPIF